MAAQTQTTVTSVSNKKNKNNLQKSNEVLQHIVIKLRQLSDNIQSSIDVVMVTDTSLIELVRHQRIMEFTVPQFQQRCRYAWVSAAELSRPRITLQL